MTEKTYQDAYKQVNKELADEESKKIKEAVKAYKTEQLTNQEYWKKRKVEAEENLRIIKLNLDNLDKGKFEAIKERIEKSEKAKGLTRGRLWTQNWTIPLDAWDVEWTLGTFRTPDGKVYYF